MALVKGKLDANGHSSQRRAILKRCRILCVLGSLCFVGAIGFAGDKGVSEAKDLQGTWQAIDLEGNGEKLPDDQVRELKIVIQGDEIYAVKPQGEDPRNHFKIDPTQTPKTIDLFPVDGPRKGQLVAGIYSLQDGHLRMCINIFGKDTSQRPREFKTQAGDGWAFVTLERVKGK